MQSANKRIPVSGPSITRTEIELVAAAAENAWYEGAGTYTAKFESEFAAYCGRKYALSLPSCTSGLHLALAASGIQSGDEVIVPDVTWIATAAPVSYVGATPVFCDIDRSTLCLTKESIESCLTGKTKAVISVNLYGSMPNYDEIVAFCRSKNLILIEDAAESIGSTFKSKLAGSFGDWSAFSFHGSKTMTTGEGGILLTDNPDLHRRASILRDHGRNPGDTLFQNKEVGFKYKMSDLQAALGLAQLSRIDELVSKKREIHRLYTRYLAPASDLLQTSFELSNSVSSYWMTSAVWRRGQLNLSKFEFIEEMKRANIDCRPVFSPLSSLEAYAGAHHSLSRENNRVSYDVGFTGVNLPSALNLTSEQIEFVSKQVLKLVEKSV